MLKWVVEWGLLLGVIFLILGVGFSIGVCAAPPAEVQAVVATSTLDSEGIFAITLLLMVTLGFFKLLYTRAA